MSAPLPRSPLPAETVYPAPSVPSPAPCAPAPHMIASMLDDPGHGVVVLRGRFDDEATGRVAGHLQDLIGAGVRDIVVEAGGLTEGTAGLVDLLGRAQTTLAARRGLLSLHDLHQGVLPRESTGPCPDTAAATAPA